MNCLGGLCDNLCNKLWFGCCWAGNGHGFRFHKVEPMLGERLPMDSPLLSLGLLKTVPVCLIGPKMVHVCCKQNIA